uniref:Uncharacterized protein n=1 Tax=Anguilla anguilla TaxID=7936 RepID=A0A0E9QPF6_ANGAN
MQISRCPPANCVAYHWVSPQTQEKTLISQTEPLVSLT